MRKTIHIFWIPTAPQRWLAVDIDQVKIMVQNVIEDAREIVRQTPAFPFAVRHQFPEQGMREHVRAEFVAAGMPFPFPIVVSPVPPSVPIGKLESFALKSSREKAIGAAKFPQPRQRVEDVPAIVARLLTARRRIAKCL